MSDFDVSCYRIAAERLGIARPTQGKCPRCRRFYYFRGRLSETCCPTCRRPLARTSGLLGPDVHRFVILGRNGYAERIVP